MLNKIIKQCVFGVLALSTAALGAVGCDAADPDSFYEEDGELSDRMKAATPDGFDPYLVFVASGEIDALEPPAINANTHFTQINGWGEQEFADWKADRFDRLEQRFGFDLSAAEAALSLQNLVYVDQDFFMQVVQTNPGLGYRAATIGDRKVPEQGWVVREGAIQIVVINPNGINVGGEYIQENPLMPTFVPPNSFFAAGQYNVEVTKKNGKPTGETIVIDFTSSRPITPEADGTFSFFCDLVNEDDDIGLAQGIGQLVPVNGGQSLRANFRNILTFSDLNGL